MAVAPTVAQVNTAIDRVQKHISRGNLFTPRLLRRQRLRARPWQTVSWELNSEPTCRSW